MTNQIVSFRIHDMASPVELLRHPNNEIMPLNFLGLYIEGRRKGWAGGAEEVPKNQRINPKAHEIRYWGDPVFPYYYLDTWNDDESSSYFQGGDGLISVNVEKRVAYCDYEGILTDEGIVLGEKVVYGTLKEILARNVARARFGNSFQTTIQNEHGLWILKDGGVRKNNRWNGPETLYLIKDGKEISEYEGLYGGVFYPEEVPPLSKLDEIKETLHRGVQNRELAFLGDVEVGKWSNYQRHLVVAVPRSEDAYDPDFLNQVTQDLANIIEPVKIEPEIKTEPETLDDQKGLQYPVLQYKETTRIDRQTSRLTNQVIIPGRNGGKDYVVKTSESGGPISKLNHTRDIELVFVPNRELAKIITRYIREANNGRIRKSPYFDHLVYGLTTEQLNGLQENPETFIKNVLEELDKLNIRIAGHNI